MLNWHWRVDGTVWQAVYSPVSLHRFFCAGISPWMREEEGTDFKMLRPCLWRLCAQTYQFVVAYKYNLMSKMFLQVIQRHCAYILHLWFALFQLWSQDNAAYICKIIEVLQEENKFCKQNKELLNINETEQKQWFCDTYFPWPYLLIYLQPCFNIAFQSSFPLCAPRFCASLFMALFWHGVACTTGLGMPPWKWRHRPETQTTTDPGTVIEQRHAGGSFHFIH